MFFRQIADPSLAQRAYLIGCPRTGQAIVVDPERDIDRYLALAEANGLRIVAAAETHIHADFLSGVRELAECAGAHVYVSGESGEVWTPRWLTARASGGAYDHTLLHDGDIIRIGGVELAAVHTPGHTPEHLSYTVLDRGGGATEPIGVLTGDFVFVGDLGRPDLLDTAAGYSDTRFRAARDLRRSATRFLDEPDFLQVWPAHGAGSACGKALGAVPQSTVGYERRFNPALNLVTDEAAFTRSILEDQPEPPLYFGRMKQLNRDGVPILGALPDPPRVTIDDALTARDRLDVLDTRPPARHRAGRLPGSIAASLCPAFINMAGSYLDPLRDILLVATNRDTRDDAIRRLVRIGLDRVTGWIDEASLAAVDPARLTRTDAVAPADLRAYLKEAGAVLFDVRLANEPKDKTIPGADRLPYTRAPELLDSVPTDRPVVLYCATGVRSEAVASLLRRRGIDARSLEGGLTAWRAVTAATTTPTG